MLHGVETLLPIGRFARRAGLTVGALRHYHGHGVLEPARIDPVTGYRSYTVSQLEDARRGIADLDWKLHDVVIIPVPKLPVPIGEEGASRRP